MGRALHVAEEIAMREFDPSSHPAAKHICWTSLSPLDGPVEYVVIAYPTSGDLRVVHAESGKEIWFHLDLSLFQCEGALVDTSPWGDAVEAQGAKPITFDARRDAHEYFELATHIFETVTKYQPGRYAPFIAAAFEASGRVDNEDPGGQPRRHLAELMSLARRAMAKVH